VKSAMARFQLQQAEETFRLEKNVEAREWEEVLEHGEQQRGEEEQRGREEEQREDERQRKFKEMV